MPRSRRRRRRNTGRPDHLSVTDDDRTDGDVAVFARADGVVQRDTHEVLVTWEHTGHAGECRACRIHMRRRGR